MEASRIPCWVVRMAPPRLEEATLFTDELTTCEVWPSTIPTLGSGQQHGKDFYGDLLSTVMHFQMNPSFSHWCSVPQSLIV